MRVRISSVSNSILNYLSTAGSLGVIHSVFDRAVNIRLHDVFRIISLTFSPAGRLPYALMVADGQVNSFIPMGIATGQKVYLSDGDCIKIETVEDCFDYSAASVWNPHMDSLSDPQNTQIFLELLEWAADHIYQRANHIGLVPLLEDSQRLLAGTVPIKDTPDLQMARLAAPIVSRLLTALKQRDAKKLAGATAQLLGYGIGGTPSGDDLLVGLLAALHRSGHPGASPARQLLLSVLSEQLTADVTSLLSLTVLNHALSAEYSEKIQEVTRLLMHPKEATSLQSSLDRLLLHGATSGAEMFLGIYLGFQHIYNS
jgi:hypothetical protein